MTYTEMRQMMQTRHKKSTLETIAYVIGDIDATLKLHMDKPINDPYVAKLLCERDACLDRKATINKPSKKGY